MVPARVFVGYDADEALAFSVFAHSLHRRSSLPASVQPLILRQLASVFPRARDPLQSTEFAFTRFLVPWLCGFQGWALFCDGDMIVLGDVAELWAARDDRYAVMVVQRPDYDAGAPSKFLARVQTSYPRKNWSSVMLFNCARCTVLTPDYVARAPGLALHQLEWAGEAVGSLPRDWNHLVGVDAPNPAAKLVHYTLGMPFFSGYRECEFAPEWRRERDAMMAYARKGE